MAERKVKVKSIKDVSGEVNVAAGDISIYKGYTAEQVSVLLAQITSTFEPKPFDGRCPYKGLDVFEEEDAELFFGRERLVEDLVSRVKASRTLFITGPSGSGKSSLVRAGLLHALKQGAIRGSDRWLYETMKPGREPIRELALAFSRLKSPDIANYFQAQAHEVDVLNECAESVLSGHEDQRFVLFVDQFEEVFTQIGQEQERRALINMLADAGTREKGRVIVLFAMRSDFISNCATYPALNELLSKEFRQIGAMPPEELVSAIALPARQVGLPIEDELIARIIGDMRGEPGALPLMQFALKDLFDSKQAKGGVIALTLGDYLQLGGIHKSLERHADTSFAKLAEGEQQLARSIFSGLIDIGRGTADTRRTALFEELIPAGATVDDVSTTVRKLADARLIITDEQAGRDTVTIAHEKLIDAWPWLKKLVNDNREVIALQNEIAEDAQEWQEHQHDPSYLYTGARLANAREQLEARKLVLSGLAYSFVEAGVRAHTDELEAARQRAAQLRRRSVFLTASLIAALIAVGIAVFFGLQARQQARIALARQMAAQAQSINATRDSKQMIAVLLATQSMKFYQSTEAAQLLLKNLAAIPVSRLTYEEVATSVALSPDGKYLLTASTEGTLRLREVATGKETARITRQDPVIALALSPDGRYVAAASRDHIVRVWEAATGREIAHMSVENWVTAATFSPDGKYLLTASCDRQEVAGGGTGGPEICTQASARVWEATTGEEIARMTHERQIDAIAFSPDGRYVVSTSCDQLEIKSKGTSASEICNQGSGRLWEATTGREIARITHEDIVSALAFSPDGKYLASGSWDNTARIWDAATGREIARMAGTGGVSSIRFSDDGKYVAWAGGLTVYVSESATGREVARMTHDGRVRSVAFSPDGKYVASASDDNTARLWGASTGKEVARMTHDAPVSWVAFLRDGRDIVSAGDDRTIRVWQAPSQPKIAWLTDEVRFWPHILSADGKLVLSISSDLAAYTIRIADVATGKEIMNKAYEEMNSPIAFSPDGRYIASGSWDKTARIWDAATGNEVARITHDSNVSAVAFSPDGKYIVSASYETALVSEAATGKEITRIPAVGWAYTVAFSPDAKYVAAGSGDGNVRVWDAATGREVARMSHNALVTSLAFSPDGKYVASASYDRTARVWDASTGKEMARMTHDTWVSSVAFSPDGKYVVSASEDDIASVWEARTGREVARIASDEYPGSTAFSSDGKYVLGNLTLRWLWRPADLVADACSRLPRNLTREEWKSFLGQEPYQAVCSNLPIEQDVPVAGVINTVAYYRIVALWSLLVYLVSGWLAYRALVSSRDRAARSDDQVLTRKRFVTAAGQGAILVALILAALLGIPILAALSIFALDGFAPSPYVLLTLLPAGLWAGAAYSYFTRFHFGQRSQLKRTLLGSLAGFAGTFMLWIIVLSVADLLWDTSMSLRHWLVIFGASALVGVIAAVLSAGGALIYIFGIQKWMTRSRIAKQGYSTH